MFGNDGFSTLCVMMQSFPSKLNPTESCMRKPYTMKDGKTRSAASGPWIASEDVHRFLDFCEMNGHKIREAPSIKGHQVWYLGHWMGLTWNSAFSRYTVDRRMSDIVDQFKEGT